MIKFSLLGVLLAFGLSPARAATAVWEHEFAIYSSSSMPGTARHRAWLTLNVLDRSLLLPRPDLKTRLVFSSTSTVTGLVTKARGGVIALHDKTAVLIPPNAAPEDFTATLSSPTVLHPAEEALKAKKMADRSLLPFSVEVELRPEGQKFDAPVTIQIPYDTASVQTQGLHELDLQIFYWDRDKQYWQSSITDIDLDRHTARAKIAHFSYYRVLGRKPPQRRR